MTFRVQIDVMPLRELLDPQGKAVEGALRDLGLDPVREVRIGKHIEVLIEAGSRDEALSLAETSCRKLFANPVMEYYEVHTAD